MVHSSAAFSPAHIADIVWGLARLRLPEGEGPWDLLKGTGRRGGEGGKVTPEADGGVAVKASQDALLTALFARSKELEEANSFSQHQLHVVHLSLRALRAQGRLPWKPT